MFFEVGDYIFVTCQVYVAASAVVSFLDYKFTNNIASMSYGPDVFRGSTIHTAGDLWNVSHSSACSLVVWSLSIFKVGLQPLAPGIVLLLLSAQVLLN